MRRRKDTFVRANSIADIQELVSIADSQKDRHEAKEWDLKRKIEEVTKSILMDREEFLSFLTSNGIDPNYPALSDIAADGVVPDTVPEQSMEAIAIEEAMLPNIPNDTFLITMNLLQDKYETLQDEIEEYVDSLSKKRLHKAKLESDLDAIKKSIEEYQDKIKDRQEDYNDSIKNLDKIRSLYQNLLDFKFMFSILPDDLTAESHLTFQNKYLDRYSTTYHNKRRTIKKFSDILQDTYKPTVVDTMEDSFYTIVFKDISVYFGPFDKYNLPDKYIDAIANRKVILDKLGGFFKDLNKLISNIKVTLDVIRGIKGIGNSLVDGLITSTNEIAKSFAAEKKIEHTTLESVSNDNRTMGLSVNQNIRYIKDKLQNGVYNLDDKFISSSKKFLRKIANILDYPVTFFYDKGTNLEDHVREKVRQKYGGNIPFCDEVEIKDSLGQISFVKKIDIDIKTGKKTKDVQGSILEKKTRTDRDILSH